MLDKLLVKIEHMPMRIPFAQDGNKPKDIPLKAIALTISLNQTLGGQLGCAVKRCLHRKGGIFGSREDLCFAVNRTSGGERNPHDAIGAHGFQNVISSNSVLLQIFVWVFGAKTHIRIGGQMKDEFSSAHRFY